MSGITKKKSPANGPWETPFWGNLDKWGYFPVGQIFDVFKTISIIYRWIDNFMLINNHINTIV